MRIALSFVVALFVASSAYADLIEFTKLDVSPTASWAFSGVTITGEQNTLIAMEQGVGLGMVGFGRNGSIDEAWDTATNTFHSDLGRLLGIQVDGAINTLTIQPYLIIDGPPPIDGVLLAIQLSFHMTGSGTLTYGIHYEEPLAPFGPLTFDFRSGSKLVPYPDQIHALTTLGLRGDVGNGELFAPYLKSHPGVAPTFTYGYSLTAIDYTPTPTPEPGTLALIALGAVLLGVRRQSTSPD